jgi:hypothetical protein
MFACSPARQRSDSTRASLSLPIAPVVGSPALPIFGLPRSPFAITPPGVAFARGTRGPRVCALDSGGPGPASCRGSPAASGGGSRPGARRFPAATDVHRPCSGERGRPFASDREAEVAAGLLRRMGTGSAPTVPLSRARVGSGRTGAFRRCGSSLPQRFHVLQVSTGTDALARCSTYVRPIARRAVLRDTRRYKPQHLLAPYQQRPRREAGCPPAYRGSSVGASLTARPPFSGLPDARAVQRAGPRARAPGCLTSWPRQMASFRSCTQARRRPRSMTLRSTSCVCRRRFRPSPRLSGERDVVVTELAAERGGGLGRVP